MTEERVEHLVERVVEVEDGTLIVHTPHCPACRLGIPPSPFLWSEAEEDCELPLHQCGRCGVQFHCGGTRICEHPRLLDCWDCRMPGRSEP